MAQEIYHRSEWGNPTETWGNTYLNADLTNELYKRASEYENSWVTDQLLNGVGTKPSIILTPTAYEDGILNSVKPKGGENLLTYSEELSNWTYIQNVTVTDNAIVSPDGSQNASRINETTDNAVHRIFLNPTVANAKHSFSVFLKKGTRNWAYLRLDGAATGQRTWFDLENGVLGTVNSDHIASIEDYGNGWYRCSVSIAGTTYDTTPLGIIAITTGNDVQDYVGDVNEYIYAWGAQLERGSQATAYIKTNGTAYKNADFDFTRGSSATRVNEQGLVEDVTETDLPRINYTDGEGSLLLEPQSTNLVTYSEDFSQSVWRKEDVLIESGYTAPDGTNTAYKVTENGSDKHLVILGTVVSNVDRHKSIWARTVSGTGTVQLLNHNSDTSNIFNLTTEWQRFDVAHAGLNNFYAVDFRGASTTLSEVILWGAQLEESSYATSYIPTNGSTVTRLADVCNNSGNSDLINSTEGVLYAEYKPTFASGSRQMSISDGTFNNRVVFECRENGTKFKIYVVSNGSSQAEITSSVPNLNDFYKIAIKYKSNDVSFYVNGELIGTDTTATMPLGLNVLAFSGRNDTSLKMEGNIKCVAVFKEALSDTELEKLTTI